MDDFYITTIDNPYNPFTQFDLWNKFDMSKGYNTLSYLARIAKTSIEFSDADYDLEVDRAIEEIIDYDPFGIYRKVYRNEEIRVPDQEIA